MGLSWPLKVTSCGAAWSRASSKRSSLARPTTISGTVASRSPEVWRSDMVAAMPSAASGWLWRKSMRSASSSSSSPSCSSAASPSAEVSRCCARTSAARSSRRAWRREVNSVVSVKTRPGSAASAAGSSTAGRSRTAAAGSGRSWRVLLRSLARARLARSSASSSSSPRPSTKRGGACSSASVLSTKACCFCCAKAYEASLASRSRASSSARCRARRSSTAPREPRSSELASGSSRPVSFLRAALARRGFLKRRRASSAVMYSDWKLAPTTRLSPSAGRRSARSRDGTGSFRKPFFPSVRRVASVAASRNSASSVPAAAASRRRVARSRARLARSAASTFSRTSSASLRPTTRPCASLASTSSSIRVRTRDSPRFKSAADADTWTPSRSSAP
mmetsp:Transcript_17657/g.55269  ORF Transcript_17657/g.55269 Transcript_17657/m.55269 type:complete len:392 (-) Transcript_17657:394-1569(-)